MKNSAEKSINDHLELVHSLREMSSTIETIGQILCQTLQQNRKILFIGNGGSAADAQHLAADIVGRFERDRAGLAAVALTTDSSALTSIANDYGFESIFSRQVEAIAQEGDALVAISTSGKSSNIVKAVETSNANGVTTVGLLGRTGGPVKDLVDHALVVPSDNTARIQEAHILIGHILCQIIEESLFS